jgi:hypothetical protein
MLQTIFIHAAGYFEEAHRTANPADSPDAPNQQPHLDRTRLWPIWSDHYDIGTWLGVR